MKKLVSALSIATLLSVSLFAAQSTFKVCSKDHKVMALDVDYDEVKDHNVSAHIQDAFQKIAEQFDSASMNSHEAFVTFISNLDEVDRGAVNGFPNGAPVAVEGVSCPS